MQLSSVILYIDPGTGSLLISATIGIALTLAFTLKGFFYKLIARLSGQSTKASNNFSGRLVFFSEGKNYSGVFTPVIEELIRQEKNFVYLSAEEDDALLQTDSPYCETHYIGKIKQAVIFLNTLKAKMCIMTTPQLNILTLRSSKDVIHYCHLIHSPTDIHAYKKFAFDYFDSVLCSSNFQIRHLRELEKTRNSKKKLLLKTGCTYLDRINLPKESIGKAILLAPTWGRKSFFGAYGISIIDQLLSGKHQVIYRPHPQSWVSDKETVQEVIDKYKSHPNFKLDRDVDNSLSLAQSQLLICDMSGMAYDYVFTNKKPVISIDFKWYDGGYESSDLNEVTSTSLLLEEIGQFVKPEEIININAIVKRVLTTTISDEVIDQHLFNFQKATPIACMQILELFDQL
ncbi:MAG: CDP-glycerol glycerophosphotransferase family protein [Bacteroidales bacterium]|jgi:hypothetical protein|nr:CDP-glycerol glycerophosphotransferase family protein [Bacteroidales bacterium]